MLITTVTFMRPSATTAWYCLTDQFRDRNFTVYQDTGKLMAVYSTLSDDGLTLNLVNRWKSKADFDLFAADAVAIDMKEDRLLYCINHNITLDYHGELIADENDPIPE